MTETRLPEIVLFDTLSGTKRTLEPLVPGRCGVYCCGPTVYGLTHLGNARAALVPDVMVRFLRHQGYDVRYVRNVTDIDDKIIARAAEEQLAPAELARKYADEYHRDMDDLGMLRPDVEPAVSGHLEPIIALIGSLVAKQLAYAADGDVYYRVRAFGPYGQLSKRSLDEMLEGAGSRIEVDPRKESPLDFALWKAAKPGEPAWDSPWGPGRPGWHIECSAMSSAHLGETFDIHTGGRDLIFPHHENEIAQSQGAHGPGTFARYWVHNGFINFDGEKMSKSLGNFFTTREITALYDPETVRCFLLTVHYRSGLNFELEAACPRCDRVLARAEQESGACAGCGAVTEPELLRAQVRFPGLEEADDRLAYVYTTLQRAGAFLDQGAPAAEPGPVLEHTAGMLVAFIAHMRNDFNTSGALGALSKPLAEINGLLDSGKGVDKGARRRTVERFVADFAEVARILGCFGADPGTWLARRRDLKAARVGLDTAKVEELVAARQAARLSRDFATADRLRAELAGLGVAVQDGPSGSVWTFA
ncbi:MAG: cysteine--tRNA ligase [Krumholzibacteria bacterium]|nr:cysteine--tRNA ligase [Candidatus Krumholzibacteria bacterium]